MSIKAKDIEQLLIANGLYTGLTPNRRFEKGKAI